MEKKRSPWRYLLYGLGLAPVLLCCGGFSVLSAFQSSAVSEQRKVGDAFVAALEAEHARAGAYPEKPLVPAHFTYEAFDDGGYRVYFAEPGLFGPSDMFSVWNPREHAWETKDDSAVVR